MTIEYSPRIWHSHDQGDFTDLNRIEQGIADIAAGAVDVAGVHAVIDPIIPDNGGRAVGKGELLVNAEDYLSLSSAASAAKARPGATLQLLPGKTYAVTAAVDVTGLTVQMTGATVQAGPGITAPNVFTTTGDLTIIGGTIDGNKANNTAGSSVQSCGIYTNAATWSKIQVVGTKIINCWQSGIKIARPQGATTDASTLPSLPVSLTGVTVTGCGSYGVYIQCCAGVDILACTANSNGPSGIYINLCRKVNILSGEASSNATHGVSLLYCSDAQVTGLTANSNTQHGIVFGGGSATNVPNRRGGVGNCKASNNGLSGICVDPTITGQSNVPVPWGGSVTGNVCNNNGQDGVVLTSVSRASVTNNSCDSNTTAGIGANSSNLVTFSGNNLTNNINTGLTFNAASAAPSGFYGRHVVGGNVADGNGTNFNLTNSFHQASKFTSLGFSETFGTSAPTTGPWSIGDRCRNSSPAVGSPKAWVCTVAGTPGTWVSEGNL